MDEFRIADRSVSPVIGVVLFIAMAVLLSTVVYTMAIDSTPAPEGSPVSGEPLPAASVDFEFQQDGANVIVTHKSGEPIAADKLSVPQGELQYDNETITAGSSFTIVPETPSATYDIVYADGDGQSAIIAQTENPLIDDLGGIPEIITLAYEDLSVNESDYDYSDWVIDMESQITGFFEEDQRYATELHFEFNPQARSAGYSHNQTIVPEGLGGGTYELIVTDGTGEVVSTESGNYTESSIIPILDSGDAFDSNTNGDGEECVASDRHAELVLNPDEPTAIPDNPIDETRQHGSGLPFNPVMFPSGNNDEIGIGDFRLVTVPTDWAWPQDTVHIADAYEQVTADDTSQTGSWPTFEDNEWFDSPADEDLLHAACR